MHCDVRKLIENKNIGVLKEKTIIGQRLRHNTFYPYYDVFPFSLFFPYISLFLKYYPSYITKIHLHDFYIRLNIIYTFL